MLGAFLKAGINEFEISIKFCIFLIPIMIYFKKKNFWVIIALFAYFKSKCEKNCTFSNILQKVKSHFFANIYHSPCNSYWNSKKSIKLKPPNTQHEKMSVTRENNRYRCRRCRREWQAKLLILSWCCHMTLTNVDFLGVNCDGCRW